MESLFEKYCSENSLFSKGDKVLVAVSGGVDSIVLVDLLKRTGMSFGISHCNFQLREEESNADEELVMGLAADCDVAFHVKHFETEAYSKEHKVSIQMAARELRYTWFEELRLEHRYRVIATAHHLNDSVESFFLNLVRGTGIRGLTGIQPKNKSIVRPLLFARKEEIVEYANQKKLRFREDASNSEDKYKRNFIRQNIIPQLEQLNPSFIETMVETISKLNLAKDAYQVYVDGLKTELLEGDDSVKINIENLKNLAPLPAVLYELISSYGFNKSDTADIYASLDGEPGKQFLSATHRLIKDREHLLIDPIAGDEGEAILIEEDTMNISRPIPLTFELRSKDGLEIPTSRSKACLDHAKLKYPLTLRSWSKGDSMQPLGMSGRKKLSDIFIDQKIPMNEKENIFVLESDGEIAWIVGHKIDDRFKTTEATETVCLIELSNGK